jgi:glutamate racemase
VAELAGADPARPIGIFDSGIGGLTVVRQLMRRLPAEDILYFGDSARVPYGTKSPETVTRFSIENARFLVRREIKFLIVACNTASAMSLPVLRQRFEVPMIGVIEPGARAAVAATRNRRVGVIGTIGTIRSGAYRERIAALDPSCSLFESACPLFVPLAEEGWTDGPVVEQIARIYLDPLRESGIDTLILGCTHYPLLKEAIARATGPDVVLVDTAEETVRLVREELSARGLLRSTEREGARRFYLSDIPAQFRVVGGRFLGQEISEVERVDQSDLPWFER